MMIEPNEERMSRANEALAELLRRADPALGVTPRHDVASRVLDAAMLPLARRRKNAPAGAADFLAGWVRVVMPLAAAAAIFASVFLPRADATALADADLLDSDPGALLSVLDTDNGNALVQYLVDSDVQPDKVAVPDSR